MDAHRNKIFQPTETTAGLMQREVLQFVKRSVFLDVVTNPEGATMLSPQLNPSQPVVTEL